MKKLLLTFLVTLFSLFGIASFISVKAVTLDELNQQIATYQKEITRLQAQSNTLSNQISQFNAQIKLAELKIAQTQEQISLLGGRIDQLEGSLDTLRSAFSSRAVETYKISRLQTPVTLILNGGSMGDFVTRLHYLKKIQEADRELLSRLHTANESYKKEKVGQEELQQKLEAQKKDLNTQKVAKNQLLSVTKNNEKRYQELLAQAQAQLAAFRRFITSQGGASILSNQTKCDSWGCYYNQRDSQWGNQAMGNSNSSMKEYGCLVTSMAMVASHYGKSLKPSEIAATSGVFFGNTAFMVQGTWTAAGTSMTRTRACSNCGTETAKQKIDAEILAGRPVVVGLYSGPDHFIVIKAKSGSDYIMNDPFMENGGDKALTSKYSLSNINTVDTVRVN